MAYFSNGTEGADYRSRFCSECANCKRSKDTDEFTCPILELHEYWNYDQCDDETKKFALNLLIPRDEDGYPCACSMFVPRSGESIRTSGEERDRVKAWNDAMSQERDKGE